MSTRRLLDNRSDVDFDTISQKADGPTRTCSSNTQQHCVIRLGSGLIDLDDLIGIENEIAHGRSHALAGAHALILVDDNLVTFFMTELMT